LKFRTISDKVIISKEEAEKETKSGILLVNNEIPLTGKILAIGSKVEDIEIGDRVVFKDSTKIKTIKIDNMDCLVMSQSKVLAKFDD